jgi:hypothetical protein
MGSITQRLGAAGTPAAAAALPLLLVLALAGCGGGSSSSQSSSSRTVTIGASATVPTGPPGKTAPGASGSSTAAKGKAGEAVATVNGTAIAKSVFEHWLAVTAALSASGAHGASASPSSQAVRDKTLGFLITQQWVLDEASAKGISVSAADVQKRLAEVEKEKFKKPGELQRYLARAHESEADLKARVKLELLEREVSARATAGKRTTAERQAALTSLQNAFEKKWKALTKCRPGYVMEDCESG